MRSFLCSLSMCWLLGCGGEESPGRLQQADTCATDGGVCTRFGPVSGSTSTSTGVTSFLGIPYAAPPVGALRWKPPQDPAPWTTTLVATTGRPACPQRATHWSAASTDAANEDCLHLNIWTPQLAPASPLPVMVFIHGGGFVNGDPLQYDPTPLAKNGHVVVVTFNYRLGPLGFLAHPLLTAEDGHSSGNYGFLDQQQALRWVRDNISGFGGDPNRVTIFGESAGGISVCLHGAAPSSWSLYHRAIAESGECLFEQTPLHDPPPPDGGAPPGPQSAEALGQQFATNSGCTSGDVLGCLRALPLCDPAGCGHGTHGVLDALWPTAELDVPGVHWEPNVDGQLWPISPWLIYYLHYQNPVPTLVGSNRDEATVFTQPVQGDPQNVYPAPLPANEDAYRAMVAQQHSANVSTILGAYDDSTNPGAMWNTLLGDGYFNCAARWHAGMMTAVTPKVYQYWFTRMPYQPPGTTGWGVFHSSELFYVFGAVLPTQTDSQVSASIIRYWSNFAANGDPNGPGADAWAPYTASAEEYLEIGDTNVARTGLHVAGCNVLDSLFVGH